MKGDTTSGVLKSIGLHIIIFMVLLISVSFAPDATKLLSESNPVPVIEAKFIDAQAIADNARQKAQAEAQAKAIQEQKRKRKAQADKKKRLAAEAKAKKEKALAEAKKQKEMRSSTWFVFDS